MGTKLKVLDLFSGIGGFSLGLERTGGFETVAFCEIDPFCRRVLAKHWPAVPCFEDVTTLRGEDVERIDVITGGFPCQDVSAIRSDGEGLDGKRSGLWSHIVRLAGELRPRFIFVENVGALTFRGLGRVLGDLAEMGMDAEWYCIPAAAVGAPHRRERIWIIAYTDEFRRGSSPLGYDALRQHERPFSSHFRIPELPEPPVCRVDDGIPDRVDRLFALGNTVVPPIPELLGRAILERLAA
jgi:DNA (cytosine-5)-methyltransferase 1